MRTRRIHAGLSVLTLMVLASSAAATGVSADYVGSFDLGYVGVYIRSMTVVPDGYAREAGAAVSGPTVLVAGTHASAKDHLTEFSIPALSSDPLAVATAAVVDAANNGTRILNTRDYPLQTTGISSMVELGGKIWAQNGQQLNNYTTQVVPFDAGIDADWGLVTNPVYYSANGSLIDAASYGTHSGYDMAAKRDETNVLLTTRTDVYNNTFVFRSTWDEGSGSFVDQEKIFDFAGQSRAYNFEYLGVAGDSYYVLAQQDPATQGLTLLLFDAATASDSGVLPAYTLDVTGEIAAGAGWWADDSEIRDLAWDADNQILYALDAALPTSTSDFTRARVHAFQLTPEPATLAMLMIGGMAAMRRRR